MPHILPCPARLDGVVGRSHRWEEDNHSNRPQIPASCRGHPPSLDGPSLVLVAVGAAGEAILLPDGKWIVGEHKSLFG